MGKVPIISINKTDGCHVYLSHESLNCDIISAKSSEMNILVPKDDGDFVSIDGSTRRMSDSDPKSVLSGWSFSRLASVASNRCSSLLLLLPQTEHPVPEQFKTSWDGSKLVTAVTELV